MNKDQLTIEQVNQIIDEKTRSYVEQIDILREELRKMKDDFVEHSHDGITTKNVTGPSRSNTGEFQEYGSGFIFTEQQKTQQKTGINNRDVIVLGAGVDRKISSGKTGMTSNTELYVDNNTSSGLSLVYSVGHNSFINFTNNVSLSGSRITDNTFQWGVNELVDNIVNIYSDGVYVESHKVVSNTSSTITLDSTPSTQGRISYACIKTSLLGAAEYPYRRAYVEEGTFGGVRFGAGPTGGGQNGLLYMNSSGQLVWRNPSGSTSLVS